MGLIVGYCGLRVVSLEESVQRIPKLLFYVLGELEILVGRVVGNRGPPYKRVDVELEHDGVKRGRVAHDTVDFLGEMVISLFKGEFIRELGVPVAIVKEGGHVGFQVPPETAVFALGAKDMIFLRGIGRLGAIIKFTGIQPTSLFVLLVTEHRFGNPLGIDMAVCGRSLVLTAEQAVVVFGAESWIHGRV